MFLVVGLPIWRAWVSALKGVSVLAGGGATAEFGRVLRVESIVGAFLKFS